MNLYTVRIKNQPGELAHLCDVLARPGANVELAGITEGDHGTIVFAATKEEAARAALDAAGIEYTTRPALMVRCPDQPGEAGKLAHTLARAGVNIETLLEISISEGQVVLACAVDKIDEARAALQDQVVG